MNKIAITLILIIGLNGGIYSQTTNLPDLIPPSSNVPLPEKMAPYADKYKFPNLDAIGTKKAKSLDEAAEDFTNWNNSPTPSKDKFDVPTSTPTIAIPNQNSTTPNSASVDVKYQTKSFDWNKSNANRYINSPCYKILGFNPDGGEEQEKRYIECERSKDSKITMILVGGVLVIVLALMFWYQRTHENRQDVDGIAANNSAPDQIATVFYDHITANTSEILTSKTKPMTNLNELVVFFTELRKDSEYSIVEEVFWKETGETQCGEVCVFIDSAEKCSKLIKFLSNNKITLPHYPKWEYVIQYTSPQFLVFSSNRYSEC